MALALVNRAENSIQIERGPSQGLSQAPWDRVGPESGPASTISGPTPPQEKQTNVFDRFDDDIRLDTFVGRDHI